MPLVSLSHPEKNLDTQVAREASDHLMGVHMSPNVTVACVLANPVHLRVRRKAAQPSAQPFPLSLSPIPFAWEPRWPSADVPLGSPFELPSRFSSPDLNGMDEPLTAFALDCGTFHQGVTEEKAGGANQIGDSQTTKAIKQESVVDGTITVASHGSTAVVAQQGVGEPCEAVSVSARVANGAHVQCETGGAVSGEVAFPELVGADLPWFVAGEAEGPLSSYDDVMVEGRVLDEEYLTSCRFYHHDPRRPMPTNIEIAFRLGNYFGAGVTRAELRQVLRRCKMCRHFMYADARTSHKCDSAPLQVSTEDPLADFVSALLSNNESSGFPSQTLRRILIICSRCDRILQAERLATHDCLP